MKRQITLISALLLASGAFAQVKSNTTQESQRKLAKITPFEGKTERQASEKAEGDLLWESDFSNPADWTIATTGQGTFIIGNNSNPGITSFVQYVDPMASTTAANGFAFFNGTQYLLSGTIADQNTTITSPVMDMDTVDIAHIEFEQLYRAFNRDVTYVEFSTDGGATWTQSVMLNKYEIVNDNPVQNTLSADFETNNSATCHVRFRWESIGGADANSGYGWAIDDVKIKQGYEHNLMKDHVFGYVGDQVLSYTKLAANQITGDQTMYTGADVTNVGNNSENAFLRMTQGAWSEDGAPIAIAPFDMDSLAVLQADGYVIPSTVGSYPVTVSLQSNNPLSYTVDDAVILPFEVTPTVSAVDAYDGTTASLDGYFDGWSSAGIGSQQGVGTYFEVFADGVLGSVQVGIGNIPTANRPDYVGELITIEIRDAITGDVLLDPVDVEETYLLNNDFGKLKKFYFDAIDVTAGQVLSIYFVAFTIDGTQGSTAGTMVPVATAGYVPATYMIGYVDADNFYLGSDDNTPDVIIAPVVRADFQDYASIKEADLATDIVVAPNPFSSETAVNFTLKADAEVSVVVTDLAGRVVLNVPAAQMAAGNQSIAIDGSSFNAGVYNYTLTIGGSSTTKRIVKK